MTQFRKLAGALLLGVGSIGIAGCAATLPTQVTRHQAMPAAAGQTFYVVPASGQPTLEFGRYASLVSQHLQAKGYRPAGAPQVADMLVKLDYQVDEGETEYRADPIARSRMYDPFYSRYDPAFGVYYGRPYYSRYGGYSGRSRDPFYWGWDDPFWYDDYYGSRYGGYDPRYGGYGSRYGAYDPRYGAYGSRYGGYGEPVREYTVYESELNLNIVRRADNAPLFEGTAQARSQTDELGILVPNLVEAMFTGFPGRSGETVRITVQARKRS